MNAALLDAAAPLFASAFALWDKPVTWLELLASVLSILMVLCNIRVNILGWPLAIASSLLFFLLFWKGRLYGDAALQILFASVSAWGWWQWLRGDVDPSGTRPQVRELGKRGRLGAVLALAIAWPATGVFLARFTDTDVPWWDAFPTAGSVIGQWLLGHKYVENWPAWIAVNIVAAALFAYKGLWLTALLYTLFVVMSLLGWRSWRHLARAPAG